MKRKRKFDTLADDPELAEALEFCNRYVPEFYGIAKQSTQTMTVPPSSPQISHVLSGKAAYTPRNLNILLAVCEGLKIELIAREETLEKIKSLSI